MRPKGGITRPRRFTVGVDGGATRCRVLIRDVEGRMRSAAEGPAANIYVDFDGAIGVIRHTVAEALAAADVDAAETRDIAVGIGLAGVTNPVDEERVAACFPGFCEMVVASDAVAACIGAFAGADGGIVIAGTGSAALALIGGKRFEIGGRGFIIGDDGSAARIGCDALRRALRACDGLAPHAGLTRQLMEHFRDDPVAVTAFAQKARPSDFGAFAPIVFAAAQRGDPVGREIVAAAADAIAALVYATRLLGAPRIALVGGLGEVIRPFLSERVAAAISPPLHHAVDGAILMAGGAILPPERYET